MSSIVYAMGMMWKQLSRTLRFIFITIALLAGSLHFSFLILILQINLLQLTIIDNYHDKGIPLKRLLHERHLTKKQWILSSLLYIIGTCLFFDSLYFLSDTLFWRIPTFTIALSKHPFPLTYLAESMLLMIVFCVTQLPCFLHRIQYADKSHKTTLYTLRNRQLRGLLILFYAITLLLMLFLTLQHVAIFEWIILAEVALLSYVTWRGIKKVHLEDTLVSNPF